MKSKALNYFLIAVVALVWGVIIYRIVAASSDDEELAVASRPVAVNIKPDEYVLTNDTAKLLLNYPDPFSAAEKPEFKEIPVAQLVSKPVVPANVVPRPAMNWGFINYKGYIRNASTRKLLAILDINGKEYLMNEGETSEQVRLLKNMKDSVKVLYGGKTRFVTLNTK